MALETPTNMQHDALRQAIQWSVRLEQAVYTDFETASQLLIDLERVLQPDFPADLHISYLRGCAFMENQRRQYEASLAHAEAAFALLEKSGDTLQLAELWVDVAAVHLNCRDWPKVVECLEQARRFAGKQLTPRLQAYLLCREGFLNLHTGHLNEALPLLLEAESILHGLGENAFLKDDFMLTLALSGMGDLYLRLDEEQKSLEAYRKVIPIVEARRLRPRLAWHYLNAGRAARSLDENTEARAYFDLAIQHAESSDAEVRAHALANLGILEFEQEHPERARELFDEALGQYPDPAKPADFANLARIEKWHADLLLERASYERAEQHLQKALILGEQGQDLQLLAQITQLLAWLAALRSDYKSAYTLQYRGSEWTDQHVQQARNRERQELEARYELERSRQDAQMARLRVTNLQASALRAQMNPHFLFNALNAIQGLISSGKNDEASSYLAKFAKLMRQTLDYSGQELVSLEKEIDFLDRFLDLNARLRFDNHLRYNITVAKGLEPDECFIPTMILQPFVENAIEHGLRPLQTGSLLIHFAVQDNGKTLLVSITDDGVGYNVGKEKQRQSPGFQSHRSRGMEITRERLELLHSLRKNNITTPVRITDRSEKSNGAERGTLVEVVLPMLVEK